MRLNPRFSLNVNYTLGKAEGDTDSPGSFPSESYNLTTEFGRASTDIRHRFTLAGNIETRWGISFSPLIVALSGAATALSTEVPLRDAVVRQVVAQLSAVTIATA